MSAEKRIERAMNGKSNNGKTPRERLSPAESSLAEEVMKCIRELFRGKGICVSRFKYSDSGNAR